jgi:aspartokinase
MNNNFQIVVQKYGGSSVAEPKKIKAIAQYIKSYLKEELSICVVVSAMGQTTNQLISLAHEVCLNPIKRELDMLISCGERSSMALLAMALNDIGIKAISLTGSQSGIITDGNHNGAEIIAIKPIRVIEAFNSYQVVIIAGFQGISENKEITTLRRGGSDTTAVAMAAAIGARECEIYTDVSGIMDIDPRMVESAQLLPKITFSQMETMALYGAKIVAHDAIKLAREFGIDLRIAKTLEPLVGSTIRKNLKISEKKPVIAITHLRAIVRITLNNLKLDQIFADSNYFLCGSMRNSSFIGYASNDISQELIGHCSQIDSSLALVTLHLARNQFVKEVLLRIDELFSKDLGFIQDLIIGNNEIFIVLLDEQLKDILKLFHEKLLNVRRSS